MLLCAVSAVNTFQDPFSKQCYAILLLKCRKIYTDTTISFKRKGNWIEFNYSSHNNVVTLLTFLEALSFLLDRKSCFRDHKHNFFCR
jgi:hypothetical protein